MSITDQIKERHLAARKSGLELEKNAFSVLLGEIQLNECRSGTKLPDEKIYQIIRTIIAGNQSTIAALNSVNPLPNMDAIDMRCAENDIYNSLLPQTLSAAELERAVYTNGELLTSLANVNSDGQATGLIVKYIKSTGKNVDGNVAKEFAVNFRNSLQKVV